jgi:hypothetical protein
MYTNPFLQITAVSAYVCISNYCVTKIHLGVPVPGGIIGPPCLWGL